MNLANEMSIVASISNNVLKGPTDSTETTFSELWKKHRCVIIFFRRWGCPYCRLNAERISAIQPVLAENNVKLIGVGLEQLGKSDFIKGMFFEGDVFVDEGKKTYDALDFKTMSFPEVFQACLSVASHIGPKSGSVWECMRLGGNMSGDRYQLGGCLVVEAGGGDKPLLHYIQPDPLDHVDNAEILRVLGIKGEATVSTPKNKKIQ